MPKQLVAIAPRKAALLEYEERELGNGEVRVKVQYATPKHGSELSAFRGEEQYNHEYYDDNWKMFLNRAEPTETPFGQWNLGNQWIGHVIEIGSGVEEIEIGDRLCGYGGIRETAVVTLGKDSRLKKMTESMVWQNALCFDPAQFALGAIRDAGLKLGDVAIVMGLGAIGQLAVQMCREAGASIVIATDPLQERRNVALRNGADLTFDPTADDIGYLVKQLTDKRGADVIIETSAHWSAFQHALRALAYGGTIAYAGWARSFPAGLDLGREAHFNSANLVFSRACSDPNREHPRWSWKRIQDEAWRMLESNRLNCLDIVHPIVSFEQCAEAYMENVERDPKSSIKLGVTF